MYSQEQTAVMLGSQSDDKKDAPMASGLQTPSELRSVSLSDDLLENELELYSATERDSVFHILLHEEYPFSDSQKAPSSEQTCTNTHCNLHTQTPRASMLVRQLEAKLAAALDCKFAMLETKLEARLDVHLEASLARRMAIYLEKRLADQNRDSALDKTLEGVLGFGFLFVLGMTLLGFVSGDMFRYMNLRR
jgi:hypothetical protein